MDADTDPGRRALTLAGAHLADFAARAAEHDRDSTFVTENFAETQASGLLAAVVPEPLGGLGPASVHDWIAVLACLATADASTPLALNMHLATSRGLATAWRDAVRDRQDGPAAAIATRLRAVAAGDLVFCATATEAGTDFLRPRTTATRIDEGWRLDGPRSSSRSRRPPTPASSTPASPATRATAWPSPPSPWTSPGPPAGRLGCARDARLREPVPGARGLPRLRG